MSSHGSRSRDRVRTAVIPAAGLGTRMLPATKSVPKELLALGERPALQFILDEAFGAGVDRMIVVSSRSKPAIADYLSPSSEIEGILERLGRGDLAREQRRIGSEISVTIVFQDEPRGLGHAVACARTEVGDEPFFVLLPDELMQDSQLLREMIDVHSLSGTSVVAVKKMPRDEISRYGVISPVDGRDSEGPVVIFDGVVEKPEVAKAPSDLAIIGRYLLTPDIFEDLERLEPSANGELQLSDALAAQASRRHSSALVSSVGRRDIGYPLGWVQAVVEQALNHVEFGPQLRAWIVDQLGTESTT